MQRSHRIAVASAPSDNRSRRALVISNITLLSLCRESRAETSRTPRGRLIEMYVAQHLGTWQQAALDF